MDENKTRTMLIVEGGELHLWRKPGEGWRVNFWERVTNPTTALADGMLWSARLNADKLFPDTQFESAQEAADAVEIWLRK
jgi:hypothetical protein